MYFLNFSTVLLLISALHICGDVNAQEKNVDTNLLYWLRINPKIELNNNWSVNTEIEIRRFMFPDRRNQTLLPRVIGYKNFENNYSIGFGLLHVRQILPQDKEITPQEVRPELRPFIDFFMRDNRNFVKISHRYRLEQRFRKKTEGTELANGWNMDFRIRYRLQFVLPLIQNKGFGNLKLKIYDEVMINIGDDIVRNTFDQNRFHIGASTTLNDKLSWETGMINWFQQLSSGDDFRSNFR